MACTKQKARPPEHSDQSDSSVESADPDSTSYQESLEDSFSDAHDISETSDVGLSAFIDDEAEEGCLSSELEEMAWEASGESDGGEEGEGFIVDEAEEEDVYQARRRRRRAVIQSCSESDEDDRKENGKRSRRRAYIADSSEASEVENTDKLTPVDPCKKDQTVSQASPSAQGEESSTDLSSDNEYSIKSESQESEVDKDKSVPTHLKWKEGLAQKAEEAYKRRLSLTTNLHKLIYSNQPLGLDIESESDSEETANDPPEVGGMFRVAEKQKTSLFHEEDSSLVSHSTPHITRRDWAEPDNISLVKGLFVTGDWGADDAEALLAEDDDLYGDFEDLETGDTHVEGTKEREDEKPVENKEQSEKKRSEKKKKQKAIFDSHYDDAEGEGGTYLDDLKREVSEQEKRNRAEFESMDEATRQMYEGVRPGSYVRMEFKGQRKCLEISVK